MSYLESKFEEAFREEEYTDSEQESIKSFLSLLDHQPTREHSIRSFFKAREIANLLIIDRKEDRKPLLTSAVLHDIGKHFVDKDILDKTVGYTKEDHEKMKIHPEMGYRLLITYDPVIAGIVLRHHRFQKEPYPLSLPKSGENFEKEEYAKLVSLIDFHDALTSRKNERFGANVIDIPDEKAKQILTENKPDQKMLIEQLYNQGIFGRLSPFVVSRNVVSACVLEPVPPKPGCTSRCVDSKDTKTLEMFLKVAVNIGPSFHRLTEYLQKTNSHEGIYQFLYEAMSASKIGRKGGK